MYQDLCVIRGAFIVGLCGIPVLALYEEISIWAFFPRVGLDNTMKSRLLPRNIILTPR